MSIGKARQERHVVTEPEHLRSGLSLSDLAGQGLVCLHRTHALDQGTQTAGDLDVALVTVEQDGTLAGTALDTVSPAALAALTVSVWGVVGPGEPTRALRLMDRRSRHRAILRGEPDTGASGSPRVILLH